ncbi:hypothetical protein INQ51_14105 [Maribellus sp. CM-23]|uniref:hypothetical protein n=1 Tax=Maribellus sp. CM-23 TaxID=2781026 RepID=UPI001F45DB15|nr:hypothetical protein [Maribellus sp. CM-23]MCE4565447.1 hypothetical protein [Maribellus sp. CM-23]
MKNLLLTLILLISFCATYAQDKIITTQKDTIECRIISVNADRISYEQKIGNNKVSGRTIATSEVLQYLRSDTQQTALAAYKLRRPNQIPEHRFLFSVQSGLSHSFTDYGNFKTFLTSQGNSASAADDYIKKLKNGYFFNTSIHYLLNSYMGVGIDYSFMYSSSEDDFMNMGYSPMNVPAYVRYNQGDKTFSNFIGASLLFKQSIGNKGVLRISESIAPGLLLFRNESRSNTYQIYWGNNTSYEGEPPYYLDYYNTLNHSKTFAVKGGLSAEYCFTPQISAGVTCNYTWAKLRKISIKSSDNEINDQELENDIDVSHIDYGFIFRFSF